MEKGELKVTLNYKDIAEMFAKAEQHCQVCQFIMKKLKTRLEEAGIESGIERRLLGERRDNEDRRGSDNQGEENPDGVNNQEKTQ